MSSVHRIRRRLGVGLLPWGVAEARMIDKLLNPQPGERVLEVGASSGYRIERYMDTGTELFGVDSDALAVEEGKRSGSGTNLTLGDACELPYKDRFFDKVLSVHLLEHLPDPVRAVEEMARVLKPKGQAVIVVPCERIRGDTAFAGWLRFRNLHLHRFKPPQITSLLSSHFTIQEALMHTLIPGRFSRLPLYKTPLLYYFSLAMLFKLKKL
ncbi:methyltransferase domain-containing protein [candidate division WOR-3 bacterium]|nr:methyltransferase domain-containing protein [candidate division WOR-3 bacterium]